MSGSRLQWRQRASGLPTLKAIASKKARKKKPLRTPGAYVRQPNVQFSPHGQGAFRLLESMFTVPMEILARSEPRAKVAAACIIHVWTYSRMLVYILHVYLWSDGAPAVLHA